MTAARGAWSWSGAETAFFLPAHPVITKRATTRQAHTVFKGAEEGGGMVRIPEEHPCGVILLEVTLRSSLGGGFDVEPRDDLAGHIHAVGQV